MINKEKRKILFIISNMETGGVSKSMTSLLNTIDTERYDVSLLLISPHGAFMDLLPSKITIISNPILSYLAQRLPGFVNLLKSGHLILAFGHLLRLILSKINKSLAGRLLAWLMPAIEGEYDTIVDYNGQQQLYYMVNKLKARKKVTFFHSDYAKWDYYYAADRRYFSKVDYIFTISNECVESLKRYFPECSNKIGLMENISSPKLITEMAKKAVDVKIGNDFTLATLGHVVYTKGIDLAIEAAKLLKNKGYQFQWLFIGKVAEPKYIALVKQEKLDDCIRFIGVTPNPYPYLANADTIVHPSRFEGRSIALDEAKILCKPIVVTNFSTVNDQFSNRINASICDMNAESIASSIEELINDACLREKYITYLSENISDNSSEIQKLYEIFDK